MMRSEAPNLTAALKYFDSGVSAIVGWIFSGSWATIESDFLLTWDLGGGGGVRGGGGARRGSVPAAPGA